MCAERIDAIGIEIEFLHAQIVALRKERKSLRLIAANQRPEVVEARTRAARETWKDPEIRARRCAAMRKPKSAANE